MNWSRTLRAVTFAALLALPAQALAAELTPVTTQLGWLRNGQYAPLLIADAKGFFKEEGIEHTIRDGGPGKNPVPVVAVGQADFGISSSARGVIAARVAADPVNVVALGAVFQDSPYGYVTITTPDAPEPTPQDMVGKRIGIQADGDFLLAAFARQNGISIPKENISIVQGGPEPLLIGDIDFMSAFIFNQPYLIEVEAAKPDAPEHLKGKVWKVVRYAKYGMLNYPDVIFATDQTVKERPELVRKYLKAITRAVQFIIDNPAEAEAIVTAYPGQVEDAAKIAWRAKIQTPMYTSADTQAHGLLWMDPKAWERLMNFFKEGGEIPRVLPVEEVMTNAFLPGKTN